LPVGVSFSVTMFHPLATRDHVGCGPLLVIQVKSAANNTAIHITIIEETTSLIPGFRFEIRHQKKIFLTKNRALDLVIIYKYVHIPWPQENLLTFAELHLPIAMTC